ncbi:MAG: serine/threonine protein phosphatase [Cyanobacteria bacterium CRU_2_1]|nr:serine/threonine protein phosphatase [Cyanobacteria bacterium RU_5_0]NJR59247.1 serine/threonine protein phosphatase [Cyanobacteria bacterium CRU_2_1]
MSVANSRRIFIGDVHGHYDGLMRLLEAIALSSDDQLYFVGDLIDRGPKSAQVVRFVRDNAYPCVMGNHEQLLLESFPGNRVSQYALQAWLQSGGQSTVTSFDNPEVLLENLDWFRSLPTHLDLEDIWLVHAGLHPGLSIDAQTAQEYCWIREEFHSMSKPYFDDKLIITGHTITFTLPGVSPGELAQGQGWLDIDTGAYHPKSGWLTGFDFTNQQVYQVNVFQNKLRVLPLSEVAVQIEPTQVQTRRRQLLQL